MGIFYKRRDKKTGFMSALDNCEEFFVYCKQMKRIRKVAEQLFGHEQVAERIANIRLTCQTDQQKGVKIMDLKNYSTGVQHVGIPTNDIEKTVEFYHKLGFETAFETVNEEANEKVVFLKLGTLVVETYENHAAKMEHGAIDHVALDVRDIEEIYEYINEAGLNSTQDTIHFLPFWENGVKFFTIEGPNKEKVEFSQYL